MRKLLAIALLTAGAAWPQQSVDANSIIVAASRTVVLTPTDITFMITVTADMTVPLAQILSAVDFGLTTNDLVGISSFPGYVPPYGSPTGASRISYTFRLSVPMTQMKDTVDKLEKLRKSTDTGVDLAYSTSSVGPTQAAVDAAREKALPELMSDARKRAQDLATAAGLKLGNIQGVSEFYSGYSPGMPAPAQPVVTFSANVRFAAQ
jgi:hypothetical protein